jgi:proteasome activator subunit 4
MIPELFNYIESERLKVVDLPPHTILNSDYIYTATTVLTWLRQELKTSIAILFQDFADNFIVPFLLKLISMKEVCQLGNINPISVFKKVSQIPFTPRKLEDIIEMLESYHADDLNVVQSIIMGEFTETFFFTNLFKFNKDQRHRLIELVHKYIFHKNVEIRESASSTFSGLIHMSPPEEVECLISTYSGQFSKTIERIRRKYRKIGYKNIETDDSVQLHGATLGLGAIVHAFSFSSPPPKWVPQILASLATNSCGVPGITGKTAKDILGKFKKNRQDTWHIDSRVFSETQMQDLEGVLWRSYYI